MQTDDRPSFDLVQSAAVIRTCLELYAPGCNGCRRPTLEVGWISYKKRNANDWCRIYSWITYR